MIRNRRREAKKMTLTNRKMNLGKGT